MARAGSILRLSGVRSTELLGRIVGELDLTLEAGDLALVDARDSALAASFADLCCGLHRPAAGEARFLERDWSRQPLDVADALRGSIGRVMSNPGWLPFLDAATNIVLRPMYHTYADLDALYAQAMELAVHFGLPGLPGGPIAKLSPSDLTRAGYVRAFLGQPNLVILESPVQGLHHDVVPALLNRIAEVRDRGGAAIWLTRSRLVWDNAAFPATHRLRLDHLGLAERQAA